MAVESMVALGLATAFLVGLAWYANRHRAKDNRTSDTEDRVAIQTSLRNIYVRILRLSLPLTEEDLARNRAETEEWRAVLETRLYHCPAIRPLLPSLSEKAWEQAKRAMKICHNKEIDDKAKP